MGSTLEIQLKGFEKINRMLGRLAPARGDDIADTILTRITLHLQSEVTTSGDFILHGRGDADPLPDKLTSRHGGSGLVGSIAPDYTGLPRVSRLGSDLPYAGVHEDSARAYLAPTYDKAEESGELLDIAFGVIEEELDHAGVR